MRLDTTTNALRMTTREWTGVGIRAGWIRQSRRVLVEWQDGSQPETVGVPDAIPDEGVARFLRGFCGSKVKCWRPAGRKTTAPLNPLST